jgi:antigen 43
MTTYTVSSGVSSGITLNSGDFLYVISNGTAVSTTVNGGREVVASGGTADDTAVAYSGADIVSAGGTTISTTVGFDAYEQVYAGTASFTTVSGGGAELVTAFGTANDTTVDSGGTQFVFDRGRATDATVSSDGYQNVSSGGTANDTTVDSGGSEYVFDRGTATDATVNNGGSQRVNSGGSAISTIVNSGGSEYVFPGGTTSFTTANGYQDSGTTLAGVERVYGTASGTTVNSGGVEQVYSGGTAINTTVNFNGTVYLEDSTAISTTADGGTEHVLFSGMTLGTTVNNGGFETVSYGGTAISTTLNSGGTEELLSGNAVSYTTVSSGGAIDVTYLSYTSGGSASVNTSGLLTVSVGGQSYSQQLSGDYAADAHFLLAKDAGSGTLVTAQCFRSGTRILTERGELAVEALRIGDLVQTVLGGTAAPIIWVGRRDVDCAGHPQPRKVWPVCVSAGAFGPGRPHSDLFLSPDHAVYVDNGLIPVRHLINGSTIMQVPVDRVTYHHIELAEHNVVLAEGLPAESFLDMRDRSNYVNRPGPVRLCPDFTARMWEAFGCAPLIVTGPELAAARALVARFTTDQAAA